MNKIKRKPLPDVDEIFQSAENYSGSNGTARIGSDDMLAPLAKLITAVEDRNVQALGEGAKDVTGLDQVRKKYGLKSTIQSKLEDAPEGTVQHEILCQIDDGERRAVEEKQPLENLLDNLGDACVRVCDSNIDRLAWKYKPKLKSAQEKVARLEKIVANKEKQREQREQLVKLNQQIEHFKMMKKQLSNREKGLDEKIEELREQCEDCCTS